MFCCNASLQQEFQRAQTSSLKFQITDLHSLKQPQWCSLKITIRFMTDKLYYLIQFFQEVPKLEMSKLAIKQKLGKLDKLNKPNPLKYMINASKNKTKICHIFTPWSGSLAKGQKMYHCKKFYCVVFIRLTLFLQAQFGLTSCIIVLKEFVSIFNKET